MNQQDIPAECYSAKAFGLGLQYFAAGRFSAASHFVPVCANLLHHSIEMFLKGCLVKHVGFKGLPRGKVGHDLTKLWGMFREQFPDSSLDRFNSVIEGLNKFESIRYPENLIREGGTLYVGFPSGARSAQISDPAVPEYQLSVEDIDALVHTLFRLGDINPNFFRHILTQEHASKYFGFHNNTPIALSSSNNTLQDDAPKVRG